MRFIELVSRITDIKENLSVVNFPIILESEIDAKICSQRDGVIVY